MLNVDHQKWSSLVLETVEINFFYILRITGVLIYCLNTTRKSWQISSASRYWKNTSTSNQINLLTSIIVFGLCIANIMMTVRRLSFKALVPKLNFSFMLRSMCLLLTPNCGPLSGRRPEWSKYFKLVSRLNPQNLSYFFLHI